MLERLRGANERDRQDRERALTAVRDASSATRGYLKAVQRGAPHDVQQEQTLSNLWLRCSVVLEPSDTDISRRCQLKGQFRRDPHLWMVPVTAPP